MKLKKGCVDSNVDLPKWMDNRMKNTNQNSQNYSENSSFVSPIWSQTTESRVVTLNLKPFRAGNNFSLDNLMTKPCTKRTCNNRQKFMLKPLGVDTSQSTNIMKECVKTLPVTEENLSEERAEQTQQQTHAMSQQQTNKKISASVVTIGDFTSAKQFQTVVPNGLCTFKTSCYHASPKLSHVTGQKIPITNSLNINYNRGPGYFNLIQQETDIVARGTPVLSVRNDDQIKAQRWRSKNEPTTDKSCKYFDPVLGASPSFQERLSEITQYEVDTVKFERSKKGRKKHTVSSS